MLNYKRYTRRPRKTLKRGGSFKKRAVSLARRKRLVKLIKNVSLKSAETKNTHFIYENLNLYHNVPTVGSGYLATTQSVGENNTVVPSNIACRIGDKVVARGVSFKFWLANKLDRPNVMYKIVFFKYQSAYSPVASDPYYQQGTTNYMIRDLDVEKFKVIKVLRFNVQTSAQRITSTDTFQGAEGHKPVSVWIPMKNRQIVYENGSQTPKFENLGFSIVAYDSYGTLTTDNIASFAYNMKFYFKDP